MHSIATHCAHFYTRNQPFWESVLAIPPYTTPALPDAVPYVGKRADDAGLSGPAPNSLGERWTSWLHLNRRAAQVVVDLAMIATIVVTFAQAIVPADVMFHVVFVLLTVHAFLFGLRGTLLRIGIVSLPLLAYANARLFGWDEPAFDLAEWPLMFVIAILVAWMADRRDATAHRYASLFRQASERLLTVEEDERRRIALELHDGVGQVLTALTLTLDAATGAPGPRAKTRSVHSARLLANTALAEVRHLAHRMRPARLEERGLAAAIRDLAGQSGFPVRVHGDHELDPTPALEPTATVGVYRIIQEALANAARHSGAPVAHVWIRSLDGRLSVVVADEGRGFDPGAAVDPGIGLAGMYERAELLGGRLSIQSAPGSGTRVTLDLPVRALAA
ncbi:MAG: sensor histidine kinase [Chloroflexota bacterium]|nr:sensor histidine kinase [Chloroflexota bacterium]